MQSKYLHTKNNNGWFFIIVENKRGSSFQANQKAIETKFKFVSILIITTIITKQREQVEALKVIEDPTVFLFG